MKMLITLCSLVAAIGLGWQYHETKGAKDAAEARHSAVNEEMEAARKEISRELSEVMGVLAETRAQLDAANAQLVQLSAKPVPTPKPNWIEERIKNWRSPLTEPASGNRRAVTTTPPIFIPGPTPTIYSDSRGRYWLDSLGARRYVP